MPVRIFHNCTQFLWGVRKLYQNRYLHIKNKKEGNPSFLFLQKCIFGVPCSLQKLADAVHHGDFVLHHTMRVAVKCDIRVFMPEYIREGFDVHSALEGAGGKGVSQRVKASMLNF